MNNNMLRFGIIGTGAIAGHHIASINEIQNCQVAALCSSTEERARLAQQKFGINSYASVQEMLVKEEIDVVCILTQSGNHLEPALAAAKAGKHVITEKPLEVTVQRADLMIEACKKAGVKLACIFQNRYTPSYQQLKKAVREGKLGKLILGNAYIKWYRDENYYQSSDWKGTLAGDGGAALINQGIHTIDLLLDIMGPVREVFGKTRTMVHRIEGEDLGLALLSFQNGALGAIQASTAAYPGYPERLEIFGENGSIILEGGVITAWNIQGEPPANIVAASNTGASNPMDIDYILHKTQIEEIVQAIRTNQEPLVNGEVAKRSLALIQAIYRSNSMGQPVFLNGQ